MEPWQRIVDIAAGPEYQKRVELTVADVIEPWMRREIVADGEPWQRSWAGTGEPWQRVRL